MAYELTFTEEHYLKEIYLQGGDGQPVPVKAIAHELGTRVVTVGEMLKRLQAKGLLQYQPYVGVTLLPTGATQAKVTLRRQRLWEVFLVNKLRLSWDEVHAATEELEHVRSDKVINRLEAYLGHPRFDPHGDPIPDAEGNMPARPHLLLSDAEPGQRYQLAAVTLHQPAFLRHLERLGLRLHTQFDLLARLEFDGTVELRLADTSPGLPPITLSPAAAEHLCVEPQAAPAAL